MIREVLLRTVRNAHHGRVLRRTVAIESDSRLPPMVVPRRWAYFFNTRLGNARGIYGAYRLTCDGSVRAFVGRSLWNEPNRGIQDETFHLGRILRRVCRSDGRPPRPADEIDRRGSAALQ